MNPTIKLFREKFHKETAVKYRDSSLRLDEELEQFLFSEIQKAREEGMKDGEGTKNGVQRYQMGYRDGRIDVLEGNKYKDCWRYKGHINKTTGYASVQIGGKNYRVHRLIYELVIGKISKDKVLDHLCRVKDCINPFHLEAVSQRENVLRGVGLTANNSKKTECIAGHSLTDPENVYMYRGSRQCKICKREGLTRLRRSRGILPIAEVRAKRKEITDLQHHISKMKDNKTDV